MTIHLTFTSTTPRKVTSQAVTIDLRDRIVTVRLEPGAASRHVPIETERDFDDGEPTWEDAEWQ